MTLITLLYIIVYENGNLFNISPKNKLQLLFITYIYVYIYIFHINTSLAAAQYTGAPHFTWLLTDSGGATMMVAHL